MLWKSQRIGNTEIKNIFQLSFYEIAGKIKYAFLKRILFLFPFYANNYLKKHIVFNTPNAMFNQTVVAVLITVSCVFSKLKYALEREIKNTKSTW